MKAYIINTLIGIFAIDSEGNLLNYRDFNKDNQRIIKFYSNIDQQILLEKEYKNL